MTYCITKNGKGIWHPVKKRRPCPICGKPDWCVFAGSDDSPTAVICARRESPKKCGGAGWLHILRRDGPTWSPSIRKIEVSARRIGEKSIDFDQLADEFRATVNPAALERLASSLGLSVESLQRLGVGWSASHRAWAFPMKDAGGKVLGVRLRLAGGRKISVRGGHEGLFIPGSIDAHDLLLITEGPTDAAALLDLEFCAVGRPSCTGGVKLLVELVRKHRPAEVVIVADCDSHGAGQRGAESLAAVILAYSTSVRVITPPSGVKDAREWVQRGGTAADVVAMIDAAPIRKLSIRAERGHHGR